MHRYRLSYRRYSIDKIFQTLGSRTLLNESDIFAGERCIYIYLYWRRNCIVRTSSAQRAYQQSVSRHARVRDRMLAATDAHYRAIAPIFPFFQANASIFLPALLIGRRPRSGAFRSFSRHLEKVTGNGESRGGKSRGQLFRSRSLRRCIHGSTSLLPYLPSNALLSLSLSLSRPWNGIHVSSGANETRR